MSRKKQDVADTRPINSIMNLKSNEDLRSYLQDRPELNLSLMRQKNGATLLHFAAYKNELSKLKIYILHFQAFARQNLRNSRNDPSFENQLKAWINVQNNQGMTALHFAGLHGNIDMINFLQRYGANMKVTNKSYEDVLFMATQNNHLKTVAYLLQHRQGKIPFNPNSVNIQGNTPLHISARSGHYSIVSYLLSLPDQDIDRNPSNHEGQTPLMVAVNGNHKEIVKRMLMKGVNRHITDKQEQKAIDIARAVGNPELIRVLNDNYSTWQKIKIACNVKIVYQVQKPTRVYQFIFLLMFHLIYLPSNIFAEVTLFDTPYIFYAIAAVYYLLVIILFCMLTKKHPKKISKDIQEIELPLCPQCRDTMRFNQFHCFICGVCVWRYDHHCPWINNCVSALNVGKFITFLSMIIIACAQIIFMALCLELKPFEAIAPTTLLSLDQEIVDLIVFVNSIVSTILAAIVCLLVFNLLGDQLVNTCSNTTSYERAKNLKKESLLTSRDRTSLNESQSQFEIEEEEEKGCFSNCCSMLGEKYTTSDQ